jgi:hypothetical protein
VQDNKVIDALVIVLRDMQERMTDAERADLWSMLQSGYCRDCGSDVLPCYGHRDE